MSDTEKDFPGWVWGNLPKLQQKNTAEKEMFPFMDEFLGEHLGEKDMTKDKFSFYSEKFLESVPANTVVNLNKTVHVFLQNKGGCGKTFCAYIFAQYVTDVLGLPLRCFDLEQSSINGFAGFKALNVRLVEALDTARNPVRSQLDTVFETVFDEENEGNEGLLIVDTGASFYNEVLLYINEVNLIETLAEYGWRLVIHSVIPGNEVSACLEGYRDTRSTLRNGGWESVVWINEFFGNMNEAFYDNAIVQRYSAEFGERSILLPQITDTRTAKIFGWLRDNHMTFHEFAVAVRENTGKNRIGIPASNDFVPGIMDLKRLQTFMTLSTQGTKGVFSGLNRHDWSPHPLSPEPEMKKQ